MPITVRSIDGSTFLLRESRLSQVVDSNGVRIIRSAFRKQIAQAFRRTRKFLDGSFPDTRVVYKSLWSVRAPKNQKRLEIGCQVFAGMAYQQIRLWALASKKKA